MTGVNLSSMRPWKTSLPVVTMPTRLCAKGSMRKIGPPAAAAFAASIFAFSITSGITRVPAILSPGSISS